VLQSGPQRPSVWRIGNLSTGGAGLVGDGVMVPGRQAACLHVAGFPALELEGTVLRQQLVKRGGRCAVRFLDLTEAQRNTLGEITRATHGPLLVTRRALVVTPNKTRSRAMSRELAAFGFAVREETSPGQAVAWLQREETEVLLVDESVIEADRWSLLQFVRDTAPEIRRLVIADDVRGFRLYYAMKAGLVDGLVEPAAAGDALARHLVGAYVAPARKRAAKATS
jgi:CheY-like chemotaxis protein